MRISVLHRNNGAGRPGITGVARVGRRTPALVTRLRPGDIAVIDHLDLDKLSADALVAARAAAVLNVSASTSGRYPNLGPKVLLDAGLVKRSAKGTRNCYSLCSERLDQFGAAWSGLFTGLAPLSKNHEPA